MSASWLDSTAVSFPNDEKRGQHSVFHFLVTRFPFQRLMITVMILHRFRLDNLLLWGSPAPRGTVCGHSRKPIIFIR